MNFKTVIAVYHKTIAIVAIVAILCPSIIKIVHSFEHHKHNTCTEKYSTHFHEFDVDCEFYKFKITPQYYHQFQNSNTLDFKENYKIIITSYSFINDFQKLQTTLRGPPLT